MPQTYPADYPDRIEAERAISAILQRFTYRSGWFFKVEDGYLKVTVEVEDAERPGEMITLTFTQTIPVQYAFMREEFDWTRWLFEQVRTMEHHELQEFFRIDGKPVYEPHPELVRVQEEREVPVLGARDTPRVRR